MLGRGVDRALDEREVAAVGACRACRKVTPCDCFEDDGRLLDRNGHSVERRVDPGDEVTECAAESRSVAPALELAGLCRLAQHAYFVDDSRDLTLHAGHGGTQRIG